MDGYCRCTFDVVTNLRKAIVGLRPPFSAHVRSGERGAPVDSLQLCWDRPRVAEVRVSRTHRRPLGATTGFEDREDHRSLSTSSIGFVMILSECMILQP
jgi:hypothetical protein